MTSFRIDQFTPPLSIRSERALRWERDQASDLLAGRTIWCAVRTPSTTAVRRLAVPADEALRELAAGLDAALGGTADEPQLGAAERELCERAADMADPRVAADDVVVLHDALTALLAAGMRARGAHTIWLLGSSGPASDAIVSRAQRLLRPSATSVDAYVTTWGAAVAALMPSSDVVTMKAGADAELDWTGVLADVLAGDRAQTVGGTMHARPAVAAR